MWYKFAAYGTIDLQKYIPEKLGEDFDVDSEVSNLLSSSMVNNKLDFNLLNEKLSSYFNDYYWVRIINRNYEWIRSKLHRFCWCG